MRLLSLLVIPCVPFLLGSYEPNLDPPEEETAQSSSSRGCPIRVPRLEIQKTTLPNQVKYRLIPSDSAKNSIIMSIYPLHGQGQPTWYYEGEATTDWQTEEISVTLAPDTTYELTGVVPCMGNPSGGQVVRVRFGLMSDD